MKKRLLPTFASVRAFEASARHGVMRAAAEELSISPSAVSHQVRTLEAFVGTSLFERGAGKLTLTQTGALYLADLADALDLIEAATAKASQHGNSNLLTIHMQSSLLELWFVPLLRDFTNAYPDLQISVVTDPMASDFANGIADVSIQYDKIVDEKSADFLMAETIAPVCSADFLAEYGPITTPGSITKHPMIWCDAEPEEWNLWLGQNGVGDVTSARWIGFDLRAAALQAAREGLGFAMGRRPYMDVPLARRGLAMPLDIRIPTGFGYRIAVPMRTEHLEKVKLFSRWLTRTCKASNWDAIKAS